MHHNPDCLSTQPVPEGRRIVFLDVDGTLIDSFPGIREGYLQALDSVGVAHPDEEFIRRIPGPPMEVTLRNSGLNEQQVTEAFGAYMDYTRSGQAPRATAFPGVEKLLSQWKREGLYLSTATSKGEHFARLTLEELGLLQHLDFLAAATEDGPRRDKASVIDYALSSLGLTDRTGDILMVGDRLHDVEGARAHGLSTCIVTWGYGAPEEWEHADFVAHSPEELARIVHEFTS
ncbi:HAD hydrolase-like protein [Corynebacterium tapiri]|uniref:HAD family hydrolase n=1 Tax=Corynebacterium tapiri TaxID=1448266 RepID=A0A5C4U6N3_9CORY|nr:HAD hydrolase-like protein [Corynebacterium tapiri]TNL98740.1 HAD family hydrolase [Corynebacterium tapiri]